MLNLDQFMTLNGTPWCERCESYHTAACKCVPLPGAVIEPLKFSPQEMEFVKLLEWCNRARSNPPSP